MDTWTQDGAWRFVGWIDLLLSISGQARPVHASAPAEMDWTRLLNRVPTYVATRTLTDPLTWEGAGVLEGDLSNPD